MSKEQSILELAVQIFRMRYRDDPTILWEPCLVLAMNLYDLTLEDLHQWMVDEGLIDDNGEGSVEVPDEAADLDGGGTREEVGERGLPEQGGETPA